MHKVKVGSGCVKLTSFVLKVKGKRKSITRDIESQTVSLKVLRTHLFF